MIRIACLTAMGVLASFLAVGCQQAADALPAHLAPLRAKYLLADEPADALGVADAFAAADSQPELVLVGQIPASPEPWTKGRALFLVADPGVCSVDGGHDAHACGDGCPFCAKKKEGQPDPLAQTLAVVQFVDEQGQVLPHDARQLFGIETDQVVVVRGRAQVDGLGRLVVSANGLYVRR